MGSPLFGQPIGATDSGRDYLVPAADLSKWSGGVVGRTRERDVTVNESSFEQTMKRTQGMVYLGYRVLPWLVTYGGLGAGWTKLDSGDYGDMEIEFAGGLHANLLYHDIMAPTLLEDRIRIDAGCEYATAQTETTMDDLEWDEFSASLLFSVVNDVTGNKLYAPESMAIYAGPIYSDLLGDEVDEEEALGLAAGLDVQATERVAVTLGVELFDAESIVLGVNVNY
jgi:opacity protein-like surface antigen